MQQDNKTNKWSFLRRRGRACVRLGGGHEGIAQQQHLGRGRGPFLRLSTGRGVREGEGEQAGSRVKRAPHALPEGRQLAQLVVR